MTIEEEMLLDDMKENIIHWLFNQIKFNTDDLSDALFGWCTGLMDDEMKFIDNYFGKHDIKNFITDIDIEIEDY